MRQKLVCGALCLFFLQLNYLSRSQNIIAEKGTLTFEEPVPLQRANVKSIICTFKDSRGFMWIGTENGLFRFDGRHVIFLSHRSNDSTSIPNNHIFTVSEDNKGNIWVSTNGGIAMMNAWQLKSKIYNERNAKLNHDFDNRLLIDGSRTYAYNPGGISILDTTRDRFVPIWKDIKNGDGRSAFVYVLHPINNDELLAGTFSDLVLIRKNDFTFHRIPVFADQPTRQVLITGIERDMKGNIWITTWGDGLFRYDSSKSCLLQVSFPRDVVYDFKISEENGHSFLWLAANDRIYKCAIGAGNDIDWSHSAFFLHKEEDLNSLTGGPVRSLLIIDNRIVWAGGKKLQRANASGNEFQLVATPAGEAQDIQRIHLGSKTYYCASFFNSKEGLVVYNDQFKRIRAFDGFAFDHSPDAHNVASVAVDKYNRVWIASMAGIFVLDSNFQLLHKFTNSSLGDTLTKRKANAVFIHHDTVWIACYNRGIDLFDLSFRKLHHFESEDGSGMMEHLVWKFYSDHRDRLWICGNENIYQYRPLTKTFDRYTLTTENKGCVPRDIAERPNGHLIVASENGLIDFDPDHSKFSLITSPSFSREQNTFSACVDNRGNAWFLTPEHVVHYDFPKNFFSLFGKEEGLVPELGNYLVRSFDDRLLLAQSDKLFLFHPGIVNTRNEHPKLIITKIQVNDSVLTMMDPIKALDLDYKHNKLSFEFSDLIFRQEDQSVFAYRLEGIDRSWQYTNQDMVSFASISPGHYRFLVKARNYAGEWSSPAVVALIIHPPFWKTIWFIVLVVILSASILALIVRYIAQRNLRMRILELEKEQAIDRERNRIAQGLHDDIGSTVSSISIMSDLALRNTPTDPSIRVIQETSASLMEKVDDLVWSIQPGNDSLHVLLSRVVQNASALFEAKGIDYTIVLPDIIDTVMLPIDYRQHIYLILKEAINNLVKYSHATHASVKIELDHGVLIATVLDNGSGFSSTNNKKGNGLLNMESRASMMNAVLIVDSAPGQGTTVQLKVKIK